MQPSPADGGPRAGDTVAMPEPPTASSGAAGITREAIAHWHAVQLYPVLVRQLNASDYGIVRVGGRRMVTTGKLGVEAVALLRRHANVARVAAELARRHGEHVDVHPLLGALARAGIVRVANGARIDQTRVTLAATVRSVWRIGIDWENRLTTWLASRLPPEGALPLVVWLRHRCLRQSRRQQYQDAFRSRLPARSVSMEAARAIYARHLRSMAEQDTVTRVLGLAPAHLTHRWMRARVDIDGRSHLDVALAAGRGVMIAALHHGPYGIIPAKLASLGYSMSAFYFGARFGTMPVDRAFEEHVVQYGWAPQRMYTRFDATTIANFVNALAKGECVLVFPDFFRIGGPARTASSGAAAEPQKRGRQNVVAVAVGARAVLVNTWPGWLARVSGAMVVPARCTNTGRHQYRVGLDPAVPLADDGTHGRRIDAWWAQRVFAALAPDIEHCPEGWSYLFTYRAAPATGATGGT